jgi:hypothetical protein
MNIVLNRMTLMPCNFHLNQCCEALLVVRLLFHFKLSLSSLWIFVNILSLTRDFHQKVLAGLTFEIELIIIDFK